MLTRSVVLATTLTVGLVAGVGSSAIAVAVFPGDASGATQLVEAIALPTQDPAEGSHAWFIESTPVTLTIAKPLAVDSGDEPATKVDPAKEHDPATIPSPSPSASDNGAANGNGGSSSGESTSPSTSGSTVQDNAKEDKAKEDKDKKDKKAAEEQAKKDKAKKDKDDKAKKDKDTSDGAGADQ